MSRQGDYYDKVVENLPPRLPRGSPENFSRVRIVCERMATHPPAPSDYLARLKRERAKKRERLSWLNKEIKRVKKKFEEEEG